MVRRPQRDRGEEGSPDCGFAGRLGDGPEPEAEGEVAAETIRAHRWQFDVNAGAEKICDGGIGVDGYVEKSGQTEARSHRQTWCAKLPPFIFGSTAIVLFRRESR
jgi:hypothetical protein